MGLSGEQAERATFTLPADLPVAEVRLDGAGAAPGFVLTGPNGLRIEHPGEGGPLTQGAGFAVYASTRDDRTFVGLERPAAGLYVVADGPGPSIAQVLVANGLPEPSVTGTVRRAGSAYELRYAQRPIPGQVVRFVEEGSRAQQVLASTTAAGGTLRFTPAAGPPGTRTILAIVESRGVPRARIAVATFDVPASPALARPDALELRRQGTRVIATWGRVPSAARYAVHYALRDGRRGTDVVRRRRYVIRNVPRIDAGTIAVAALRADGRAGAAVRASFTAKPLKAKRARPGSSGRR
jgi:hypothetical protein